jgi:hypothetical protein
MTNGVMSGETGGSQVVGPPLPIFIWGSSIQAFPYELRNKNEQLLCIAGRACH